MGFHLATNELNDGFVASRKNKRPKCFIVEWLGCGDTVRAFGTQDLNVLVNNLDIGNDEEQQGADEEVIEVQFVVL